jgi:hypothetical protein
MALQTETTVATRLVTYDKNTCQQCQAWMLAPDWSEYLNELRAPRLVVRVLRL